MSGMGWIKAVNSSAHARYADTALDVSKGDTKHVENLDLDEGSEQYPVCAKDADESDLPFLAPEVVKQMDGTDHSRLWLVIDDIVYDCTDFVDDHPGGETVIRSFGGRSCSWQFWRIHTTSHLRQYGLRMRVGRTEGVENPYKETKTYVGLRSLDVTNNW